MPADLRVSRPLSAHHALLFLSACLALAASRALARQSVSVSAQCNLYGAGHAVPPNPGGGGAGILPVFISLPPAAAILSFSSASGTVLFCPACTPANGADGVNSATNIDPCDGISGLVAAARARFLAGIFVGPSEPADPAPASLSFTDGSFQRLTPGLRQTFFIGDGLTGTGSGITQRFFVPPGATRFYLGFLDTNNTLPGWYQDNSGSISITVNINTCPADLNADGQVDDADFVIFAAAYNILDCADPSMPPACPADLNGDGAVDDSDFIIFVAAYNSLICP
jgi:hypothetical protein